MKRLSIATVSALLALALLAGLGVAQQEAEVFPEVIFQTATEVHNVPGEFQLVTLVLGFPPGAWTPWHFHGGEGLVTILEGEFTLEILGQEPQTYGPGDHWKEHLGMPHRAGNETDAPARLAVTFILPIGTPTTVALPEIPLE